MLRVALSQRPQKTDLGRGQVLDFVHDDSFDVDGTTWTDAGLSCADPGRVLYRGADVLFYSFVDRNVCTGDPIFP